MQVSVAYHQVDNSKALNQFIEKKVNKLNRFVQNNVPVNWVLEKKGKHYSSSAKINVFGNEHYVHAESDNIYSSVSMAYEKLREKVQKNKAKISRSVHNKSFHIEAEVE